MDGERDHLEQNLDSVLEVQKRDWEQRTPAQRRVERISRIIGQPMFLVGLLGFSGAWVFANELMPFYGKAAFDPFPYAFLEGLLTLFALVSTTVILIAQSRQTRLEQQHTHIALQVNLLTEQKVTKLIALIEELRKDLPMVRDRYDPQVAALNKKANAADIHAAIESAGLGAGSEAEDVAK